MTKITQFRTLLTAFVVLYVYTMSTSGLPYDAPRQALDYAAWAQAQPETSSAMWGVLCLLGHVADIVGIVLLFARKKLGLYFMIAGFASCLGSGPGIPFLETHYSATLMSFVNILWGSIIALAYATGSELFPSRSIALSAGE
ncbi:hypothetical protein BH11PSE11_BH11PSE11_07420 [soil metagenome]